MATYAAARMLRELIDVAVLEDFTRGLSRAAGRSVLVFDGDGQLIASCLSRAAATRVLPPLAHLPHGLTWTPLPAADPPANVAFLQAGAAWFIVAPIGVNEQVAGYVALGEFRDPRESPPAAPSDSVAVDHEEWRMAWSSLAPLERSGDARDVVLTRWAARQLAVFGRREAQLSAASEAAAFISDLGALLSGDRDLQTVLDHIVSETARVMKCSASSLRLYNPESDELSIAAVHNLSPQYLNKGAILRSQNPIDDEALKGVIVYIEDAAADPRIRFREESRRAGIVSGLTVGMIYRGQPVGVLRVYTNHKRRFRAASRNLLRAVASQAAMAIVNARLLEERLISEALEQQLALAGEVQARMIGAAPPHHASIETARVYEPSSHVGGDFCDIFTLADGRLAAAAGDVVGHGVPASLLMAVVRGALRAFATTHSDLGVILARLNQLVCQSTAPSEFVTLILIAIDDAARVASYATAGHEPMLVCRRSEVLASEPGGLVLGLDPQETYVEQRLNLQPDDFLLLYTDGAVEAMDFDGKMFGRGRLRDSLVENCGLTPALALDNIRWDIRRFVGLAEQADDLTLVGLRRRK